MVMKKTSMRIPGIRVGSPVSAAVIASSVFLFGCDPDIVTVPTEPSLQNDAAVSGTPPAIGGYNVYYGHIHNHSNVSDGKNTPDQAYNYAKNTAKLDFFGLADHSQSISSSEWTAIKKAANSSTKDGVFVGFWGFEWTSTGKYGHVAVINTDDYCSTSSPTSSFSDLVKWLSTRNGAAFFNHPGEQNGSGKEFDHFSTTPSDKFVGMELWNKNDAFTQYFYNDGYFTNDNTKGYFDEAISRGWKIGAAGSDDNHKATWGTDNDYRLAVLGNSLTRAELFNAITARRFYSTLDKNLALSFKINGQEMGSTITAGTYTAGVLATDGNGESFTDVKLYDKNHNVVKNWTLSTTSVNVSMSLKVASGDYYYVKIKQADGNQAISSPIWVSGGGSNQPPKASAGSDISVVDDEQNGAESVTLSAAGSSDPDGAISSYVWKEGTTQIATGVSPVVRLSVGMHTITLTVTDNGGLASSDEVIVTVIAGGDNSTPVVFQKRVSTGMDDVEENSSGSMYTNSTDIEVVYDGSTIGNQTVGLRFSDITIPRNAVITKAYIQFTCDEVTTTTTSVTLRGQAADNAAAFTTASKEVSNRAKTSSAAAWSIPAWNTVGAATTNERTPELKSIVQEIVNRSSWSSSNALVFIITGTGTRTAVAYEGSASKAPLLYVEYTKP
jgi:predicted metal-dependent phosphoesterase TrpH